MARIAVLVLDLLLAIVSGVVAWILFTGGGSITISTHRISMTGIDNPLIALAILGCCRYFVRAQPFFGWRRWKWSLLDRRAQQMLSALRRVLADTPHTTAWRAVVAILIVATAVKIIFAYYNPGFFSGDDVEVQEMALRQLLHTHWSIWDLRTRVSSRLHLPSADDGLSRRAD